jgi:hypothetical protein
MTPRQNLPHGKLPDGAAKPALARIFRLRRGERSIAPADSGDEHKPEPNQTDVN